MTLRRRPDPCRTPIAIRGRGGTSWPATSCSSNSARRVAHGAGRRAICNRCSSFEFIWAPLSGRGTVASWIVNHHAFSTDFPSPYAVVLVRLAEQDDCKLIGSFAGAIESLRPGLEVRAVFDDVADGVTLLRWEPATPE